MKRILTIIIMACLPLLAQDITNKLGGTTESDTYDITDSSDNVLVRVEGNGEVGIGTGAPDATFEVEGTVKMMGIYYSKSFDTEYQADTDGFVLSQAFGGVNLEGYVGTSTPVTVIVAQASSEKASLLIPVPKGWYWKVYNIGLSPGTVYWIPLGQ